MSTEHPIFNKRYGCSLVELQVHEQSCRFHLMLGIGFDHIGFDDLTPSELAGIGFRILEISSYYDPLFTDSKPLCPDNLKLDLKELLKDA